MRDFKLGSWVVLGLAVAAPMGGMECGDEELARAERKRIEQGLALSPVPLDLAGKDRDLVGLGSYIVNAQGACNDCHTYPSFVEGGDPFLGEPEQINSAHFLSGGRPFGPDIVSTNLTPDGAGNPGGLSYDAFVHLIRTGRDEDGSILQVMPWPVYKNMTERDLRAIYEYLRAIPHAEPGP
ncbi:cytochrome C [Hyalangium gracile]|uniref:cytochrome C n=1 Tax=Hyalangium gracile TaxID=394092 RepID=UPI001CCF33C3|nr:cytochrome C [Hyalangium gracile]